ncbi:MAG: hypothetical protein IE917_19105, partial [Betaproteobacteria bacterium]|nr:hypothetical protein [Betaproteobacteria bacterium]
MRTLISTSGVDPANRSVHWHSAIAQAYFPLDLHFREPDRFGGRLEEWSLGGVLLALRAGGEEIGWAFQLQEPGVVVGLLVLALAITANFAGLFELPTLAITREGKPSGAFTTGVLAAFVATPCTGPFMAAALGAALLLPTFEALALFGSLGLGLALPFLLVGLVPALRKRLPRPGPWMNWFRKLMAVPMALTALALA